MSEKKLRADHADSIIRNHMIWSMGAGFIPVPIADFFAVTAIQLDMIRQLSRLYNVDFQETSGKAIITALSGTSVARMGARAVKFIPGIGSVLGGVTLAVLSGASTYALGMVFRNHFESGGTFLDFDIARVKKMYNEQFEKGKEVAEELQKDEEVKEEILKQAQEAATSSEAPKEDVVVTETVVEAHTTDEPVEQAVDAIAHIKELAALKEKGLITEDEYVALKKKIIDKD